LGTLLQIISDQREGARLGVAITNDTDSIVTATIIAGNTQGQTVGSATVTIPSRSQYLKFLDEIVKGLPVDHLGQVFVGSSGPQLAAIGLRFSGGVFTTIPSSVRQSTGAVPQPAVPTIASITPSSGNAGTTISISMTGTNFVPGGTTVSVTGSGISISG